MPRQPPAAVRHSLHIKLLAAGAIVLLSDQLFYAHAKGWTVGVFGLAFTALLLIARPDIRRSRTARPAIAAAILLALLQIDSPNVVGCLLFLVAVSVAALMPRTRADDVWRWTQRLGAHGLLSFISPVRDLVRSQWANAGGGRVGIKALLPVITLPLIGGAIFLGLFAQANPVIGELLSHLRLPPLDIGFFCRLMLAAAVGLFTWSVLRPRVLKHFLPAIADRGERPLPGVSTASVTLSLLVFNGLFALENGLDIAFLWSGAPLPDHMTLAGYAHQGAYPLIVTALLAGLFVLVALRPGSPTARKPLVRGLVVAWVAQNVLLVASSIRRTIDYIDAYSLTRFRIVALIWMALVGVGLILICWRMLAGRSTAWLLNANALAAGLAILLAASLDLGGIAAGWNVAHAREVDGTGADLDICYLYDLGPAALVPVTDLQRRPLDPALRGRLERVRRHAEDAILAPLSEATGWTWRGDRRARRAAALRRDPAWYGGPINPLDCRGD